MNEFGWQKAVHEAGHVVCAALLGAKVHGATLHEWGGSADTEGDSRQRLVISLGGHAAETILMPSSADVRGSVEDFRAAYRIAHDLARWEDHERVSAERGGDSTPSKKQRLALAALTAAEIDAGIACLTARWTARAEVLVAEAEDAARELLGRNRCVIRAVAVPLEQLHFLSAEHVAALVREGIERQREDDRRFGGRRTA